MKKKIVHTFVAGMAISGAVASIGTGHAAAESTSQHASTQVENIESDNIVAISNFTEGTDGWSGGFAEYYAGQDLSYGLKFDHKTLPSEISSDKHGLFLSGTNYSADLFMYVKKKLGQDMNLKPNTAYDVQFDFEIATNAPKDSFGIGGSPGENVYVKAGATSYEPQSYIGEHGNYWYFSADKGNQASGGTDALTVGNLAKSSPGEGYELKTFQTEPVSFVAKTNTDGELWLFIGTDSGFSGTTSIYISHIEATLTEVK